MRQTRTRLYFAGVEDTIFTGDAICSKATEIEVFGNKGTGPGKKQVDSWLEVVIFNAWLPPPPHRGP